MVRWYDKNFLNGDVMTTENFSDQYSARDPALGYFYEPRAALLQILSAKSGTTFMLEQADDIDCCKSDGSKILISLKHKQIGDVLTDLGQDFWKSVRIWLDRYIDDEKISSKLIFYLSTTSAVAKDSKLAKFFLARDQDNAENIVSEIYELLNKSKSSLVSEVKNKFETLNEEEKKDFLHRIKIFDCSKRIVEIPTIIQEQHMRLVPKKNRLDVYRKLEGWWTDVVINMLTDPNANRISVDQVFEQLMTFNDMYTEDNLPITYRNAKPAEEVNTDTDNRLFVLQLKEIDEPKPIIERAIWDYYRAYEERSSWTRQELLKIHEIEFFEDRLIDELEVFKYLTFREFDNIKDERKLKKIGRDLYNWAQKEAPEKLTLRIRPKVLEPYVIRGGYHILANKDPVPRIVWHKNFVANHNKRKSELDK